MENKFFDEKRLYPLIFQDHFEKVRDFLTEYGINSVDREGANFLMTCIVENKNDFVKKLIDLGVDVNAQDFEGFSALHYALQEKNIEAVEILLAQKDLRIDLQDQWGNTPLLRIIEEEDAENIPIIEKLIKKGASIHIPNNSGTSPLSAMKEITDKGAVNYAQFMS